MPFEPTDRTGRLDLLIKEGLGRIAGRAGVRDLAQPVIDLFVDQKVTQHRVPVTPIEIARQCGILAKEKQPRKMRGAVVVE